MSKLFIDVVSAIHRSGLPASSRRLIYCKFIKEVNNINNLDCCRGIDVEFDNIFQLCYGNEKFIQQDNDIGC